MSIGESRPRRVRPRASCATRHRADLLEIYGMRLPGRCGVLRQKGASPPARSARSIPGAIALRYAKAVAARADPVPLDGRHTGAPTHGLRLASRGFHPSRECRLHTARGGEGEKGARRRPPRRSAFAQGSPITRVGLPALVRKRSSRHAISIAPDRRAREVRYRWRARWRATGTRSRLTGSA